MHGEARGSGQGGGKFTGLHHAFLGDPVTLYWLKAKKNSLGPRPDQGHVARRKLIARNQGRV